MKIELQDFNLESLSDLCIRFKTGAHPGKRYDRRILVIGVEGTYRAGCGGEPDARFMSAMSAAGIQAFKPHGVITDLSNFSYVWGDNLGAILPICARFGPGAVVVGADCREALGTLYCADGEDICLRPWAFDSFDAAWKFVADELDQDVAGDPRSR